MQNNSSRVLKIREFFSDNEYIEVTQLIKISKEITIFNLNRDKKYSPHFISTPLLKVLGEDMQRIELSSVILNYDAIEYEGKTFPIYETEDPEFVDTLMEVFTENV